MNSSPHHFWFISSHHSSVLHAGSNQIDWWVRESRDSTTNSSCIKPMRHVGTARKRWQQWEKRLERGQVEGSAVAWNGSAVFQEIGLLLAREWVYNGIQMGLLWPRNGSTMAWEQVYSGMGMGLQMCCTCLWWPFFWCCTRMTSWPAWWYSMALVLWLRLPSPPWTVGYDECWQACSGCCRELTLSNTSLED